MIALDAATHTYSDGARTYPSVTTVLQRAGIVPSFNGLDPYYADRGTRLHDFIALELSGWVDEPEPDIAPFVAAWREWWATRQPTTLHHEAPVYSERFGVAGTVDWIGELDGAVCVLDWKSGTYRSGYGVQVAGYRLLAAESLGIEAECCGVLSLKDGAKLRRVAEAELHEAESAFLGAVAVHRWMEAHTR